MMAAEHLTLVEAAAIPDYPFGRPEDAALAGNSFLRFEHARWLTSDMFLHADPEVGYAHLTLIFKSQLCRPIGTIPADFEGQVAFLEGRYDTRKWRALLRCDPSPLRHWVPYRCDGGSVRLGHRVVIEMIEKQLFRREKSELAREADAVRKRLDRLRERLAGLGLSTAVLRDDVLIERMDAWLTANVRRRDADAHARVLRVAADERWFRNA